MNRTTILALLASVAFSFSTPAWAQLTVRDDLGRALVIKHAATRIVTLAPSLTELVFAAGAGDLVVGVDSLSDYPPEARKVAQVVTGTHFSIEQLAALKPDLVVAWRDGIRREDIERISAFGATVFVAQARQLEDVARLMELIGRMTGRDSSTAVADFELRIEKVKRANINKPRMTAFLEIWNRPLTTISGSHFLSEALEICRADNVFRELPGAAPKVSYDEVAAANPYVIIGAGSASNVREFGDNWTKRQALSAVKGKRLLYLDSDRLQRPSPRAAEGIDELCRTLDRVRYAGATAVPMLSREETAPAPGPAPFAARSPEAVSLPSAAAAAAIVAPGAHASATVPAPTPAPAAATKPAATAKPGATPTPAATAKEPSAPAKAPRPRPSQYGM